MNQLITILVYKNKFSLLSLYKEKKIYWNIIIFLFVFNCAIFSEF